VENGRPLAMMDGSTITGIRTAAVSGLATRLLAREDATTLAILGSGIQARTHLAAMKAVRGLTAVRVWSRSEENARRFAERESRRHGIPVETAGSVREAVAGAEIICTTTSSREPILSGEWISPGAHINAVGSCLPNCRELDTAAVVRTRLFVDRRESAFNEAGDILIPKREGAIEDAHILGEIGEILLGQVKGRESVDDITLFPTFGILILTGSPFAGPYRALLAPAGLIYFFFIILSTLRLDPLLSRLTGLFSAIGYLSVTAYTYRNFSLPENAGDLLTLPVFITYAILLLIGGFIAGAVAGQIRVHVQAALREAETRRKMERMARDLEIARSIQQGLLPKQPPEVEGFDIAGWNQPADETGGDYFDWQEFPDGRVALSLADVTGHGIGPALVTAVCRAYGRASISGKEDLGKVMDRIDRLLTADLPAGKLVQLAVAVLDPKTSKVQLLSAGQSPLLLYTAADDRVQSFNAHGVPFGVALGLDYGPSQEITLATGDMLVLVTDGFFEWTNAADEDFGLDRLQETIRASHDLPAREIISRLYKAVLEFAGGTRQMDDLTAVILKKK